MDEFTYQQGESFSFLPALSTVIWVLVVFALLVALVVWLKWYLARRGQWHMFLKNRSVPSILVNLSGYDFEVWVQQLFLSLGAEAEVTGRAKNDHGIDVVVKYRGKRIAVQCKKYRQSDDVKMKVGETRVRDLYGVQRGDGYDASMLITTGNFTWEAVDWAKNKPGLVLINGALLGEIMKNRELLRRQLERL